MLGFVGRLDHDLENYPTLRSGTDGPYRGRKDRA